MILTQRTIKHVTEIIKSLSHGGVCSAVQCPMYELSLALPFPSSTSQSRHTGHLLSLLKLKRPTQFPKRDIFEKQQTMACVIITHPCYKHMFQASN